MGPSLHRDLWRYVAEWRAKLHTKSDALFVGRDGKALQAVAVQHMIRKALRATGIKGGPHLLRHTCGTLCVRNGGDWERLRLLLGHSDFTVIQRYVHLVPEDLIKRHQETSPLATMQM
jgi:integrase/recombinase XerD